MAKLAPGTPCYTAAALRSGAIPLRLPFIYRHIQQANLEQVIGNGTYVNDAWFLYR